MLGQINNDTKQGIIRFRSNHRFGYQKVRETPEQGLPFIPNNQGGVDLAWYAGDHARVMLKNYPGVPDQEVYICFDLNENPITIEAVKQGGKTTAETEQLQEDYRIKTFTSACFHMAGHPKSGGLNLNRITMFEGILVLILGVTIAIRIIWKV